jgi:hypothetical protein
VQVVRVNARNSFGAYTGYEKRFVFLGKSGPRDITDEIKARRAGVL